jgi:hypothetical protein
MLAVPGRCRCLLPETHRDGQLRKTFCGRRNGSWKDGWSFRSTSGRWDSIEYLPRGLAMEEIMGFPRAFTKLTRTAADRGTGHRSRREWLSPRTACRMRPSCSCGNTG